MPTINNNNGHRHPTLPSRLDPLFKLTCTRIFKPGNMLEDEEFKLCLDIDDYITKARKEKREKRKKEQEQRRMEEELKEGTGAEKRKIDQVGFDGGDDGSVKSASKKVKMSSSSTSASVPSLPELPPLGTTGSSSFDETGSGLDAISSQPSSSTSTGDTNTNEEIPRSQPFPYPPYAALLKKTTGSGINITTSIATTRRPRKSGTQFTIYEDPQERQELYTDVYNEYSPLEYSSPSEGKENSEESLSGERDSDVEMMSDASGNVDVDGDGDEEMGDGDGAGAGDGGEDGSDSVSILQDASRQGTAGPESYGGGSNDPAWMPSPGSSRGEPLGVVRQGRAFNVS